MQVQIEKGSLLNESRAKLTTETIGEVTPFGLRLVQNYQGENVGPTYTGRNASTCDLFLKTDGTVDWEGRSLDVANEGGVVIVTVRGSSRQIGPSKYEGEGEAIIMTQSPKLSWLNNKKCKVVITNDTASGEAVTKIFAL